MAKCEDFPCCGHTEQDPCERQPYDEPGWVDTPHALCDHENGICEEFVYDEPDFDDYDQDYPNPDSPDGKAWRARCVAAGQPDPYGRD